MLITPSGTPASCISSANRIVLKGVCSAGLMTAEQPTASEGAIFQAAITSGKFQGKTAPATPAGSFTIKAKALGPVGAILPKLLSANSAYH